jgi:hypothetical protein
MQCTRHSTTKLFQYITYCHFCWINCSTLQHNTTQQRHNMTGRTTKECPHKSWKMYRWETSWNYILNGINILDHVPFLHANTNILHYVGHSENKWFKSIYREEQVTAVSCLSDGEGSPQLNWKPLQGNNVQHHWSKCFYFHIKWHKINFSGMTPFVSWMHHIKDDLLVGYKPTALH